MTGNSFISNLSPHLFWDVDAALLEVEKDKALIVQRVLEYGLMKDWQLLNKEFGLEEIVNTAKTLRNLDDISLNFISKLTGVPRTEFRCYINKLYCRHIHASDINYGEAGIQRDATCGRHSAGAAIWPQGI